MDIRQEIEQIIEEYVALEDRREELERRLLKYGEDLYRKMDPAHCMSCEGERWVRVYHIGTDGKVYFGAGGLDLDRYVHGFTVDELLGGVDEVKRRAELEAFRRELRLIESNVKNNQRWLTENEEKLAKLKAAPLYQEVCNA